MKSKKRFILKVIICSGCIAIIAFAVVLGALYSNGTIRYTKPAEIAQGKYLFSYYIEDADNPACIHFSVSEDGYNYSPVNNGEPIIARAAGETGLRDPYIFRKSAGELYLIAADIEYAGDSTTISHSFTVWKSADLITWSEESTLELRNFSGFEACASAEAPRAIWDPQAQKFMVYFTALTDSNDAGFAKIYYSHTSDFKKFTAPKILFSLENTGVGDGDIIYNNQTQSYSLFFKSDEARKICLVTSKAAAGPYSTEPATVSFEKDVEGGSLFNITGTGTWVLASEKPSDGSYIAIQTIDLETFTKLKSKSYSFPEGAHHGSFLAITNSEYDKMIAAYGLEAESENRLITPFSTTEKSD